MSWIDDLEDLGEWSLRTIDLRYKMIFSTSPSEVTSAEGIVRALETAITLQIYEAHVLKGYASDSTIGFEVAYPNAKPGVNPPRCDLALKEQGRGSKWKYIEVKCYGPAGKKQIEDDIKKLKSIKTKSSRLMFIYRVRPSPGAPDLSSLLVKNFPTSLQIERTRSFSTHTANGGSTECDLCICYVR